MTIREVTAVCAGLTNVLYTSGDQLGTELTFANIVPPGTGGVILAGILIDEENVLAATDLYMFNATTTPVADNAASSWSDTDMRKSVGILKWATADVTVGALNRVGTILPVSGGHPFYSPDGNLYGDLVTRSANAGYTVATALRVKLVVDIL